MKEHRLIGYGAILLCAILWSTSGLFIRLVDWHPMVIAGSRSMLAALLMVTVRVCARRSNDMGIKTLFANAPKLAVYGLCYTVTMILFVMANKLTASANAILLQYVAPVWAALLGWIFLREKPRWENWCAMFLVSIGMLMVFSGGISGGSFLGDTLAMVSGITFGANSVILRSQKDGNPADVLIFSHIMCMIFSIPFFFMFPPVMNAHNVLSILFMGVFQLGAASVLFAYGIKRVPAVQAMLTSTVEPVLNPVWVLCVTGERPALSALAGGAIILAAVVFSSMLSALRRRS